MYTTKKLSIRAKKMDDNTTIVTNTMEESRNAFEKEKEETIRMQEKDIICHQNGIDKRKQKREATTKQQNKSYQQQHKYFFCWHLVAFIDHYTHLNEIVRHQLSYMQLYSTQHAYNLLQNTRYYHFCTSIF